VINGLTNIGAVINPTASLYCYYRIILIIKNMNPGVANVVSLMHL